MTTPILYQVPPSAESTAGDFTGLDTLRQSFQLGPESRHEEQRVFYDTFDWRLHAAGLRLWWQGGDGFPLQRRDILCCRRQDGEELCSTVEKVAPFAEQLPAGSLRDEILPITDIRALLPWVTLKRQVRQFPVLDLNEKTVVRLRLEQRRAVFDPRVAAVAGFEAPSDGIDLPLRLSVVPVRGYEDEVAPLCLFLETDLELERQGRDEFSEALQVVGRRPGDYSPKFKLEVTPDQNGGEAFRAIGRDLLGKIELNEPGVRRDLDAEFLHDFRVSVRRTRTALGMLRGLVPGEALESFKEEFRWLGRVSGPKRDLDVFVELLDSAYRDEVPEEWASDLEHLRAHMQKQMPRERRKLVKALDSERYASLLADWRAFLASPVTTAEDMPNAEKPVTQVAAAALRRAFRRVFKRIDAIGPESPDDDFHRLRIQCKKVRYLMEFFRPLFPAEQLTRLIKALKRLQDQLGEFQDLSVQQDNLRGYGRQYQREQASAIAKLAKTPEPGLSQAASARQRGRMADDSADRLMLMGFLISRLERRHDAVREACFAALEQFARPSRRRTVQDLFDSAAKGRSSKVDGGGR